MVGHNFISRDFTNATIRSNLHLLAANFDETKKRIILIPKKIESSLSRISHTSLVWRLMCEIQSQIKSIPNKFTIKNGLSARQIRTS